jgi:hypothetical protein
VVARVDADTMRVDADITTTKTDAADITSIREVAADTTTKTFLQINAD